LNEIIIIKKKEKNELKEIERRQKKRKKKTPSVSAAKARPFAIHATHLKMSLNETKF
jgi:hypothetical protein